MKLVWVALGFAFGGLFIYLSLAGLDRQVVAAAFRQAHLGWALLGFPLCAIAFLIRLERFRLMLSALGSRATCKDIAAPFFGGFALNNVLPFRLGDVARAAAFTKRLDVPASGATATVLVERVFDLYALMLLGFMAVLMLPQVLSGLPGMAGGAVVAGFGLVISTLTAILVIPKGLGRAWLQVLKTPVRRIVPRGFTRFGLRMLVSISHIVQRKGSARLIALSLAAWAVEAGVIFSSLTAVGVSAPPAGAWLAIVSGNLGALLPGTPGHFGTYHYLASHALALAGTDFSAGFLAITLAHLILWSTTTAAGFALLISMGGVPRLAGRPRRPARPHFGWAQAGRPRAGG